MKIIIVSDEDKKKYEEIGKELQRRAQFANRKSKAKTCPVCRNGYMSADARDGSHAGYCSLICSNGRSSGGVRRKRYKKRQRQLLRQEKKIKPRDFYLSDEWRELRFKVLRKFEFACLACGRKPPEIVLHVDHIKPRSKYPKLELCFDNLQVLCADCNIGKKNFSEDDLRPESSLDFLTEAARNGGG